uniref:armadillo-like helical domain containing protein 1 isoform X1 n=1 Tax=Ciona intestinalis TaxID=7719 RepID=UPI000521CF54|nr:armadillo-like helical domain containing protein 1 isoform X1 [Ciona intestinalis]|eukprot:XP_009859300.1 armadillo-like helical domain containing protein 1 isoform X1 [Ciona intestinalis]
MPHSQSAVSKVQILLSRWDKGSALVRGEILVEFLKNCVGKTGPELEQEFGQAASLFLTRLTAWLRLTYMMGSCIGLQLKALHVFLTATSGHHFMAEFIEVGGVLTLLEITGLKQSTESDKCDALKLLIVIASAGRQYKELICESYGIRSVAECLAKSKSEDTQDHARILLQLLAQGNPKYGLQVYKGLIALLPSTSPKAQQMALQNLRIVQPIVKSASPSLVEPLLNLLATVHLEVQYEAIEFIRELMEYDIQSQLLEGLVRSLRPTREEVLKYQPKLAEALDGAPALSGPLPTFIKQAAAAKTIGILSRDSSGLAEHLLRMRVIQQLMYAMGNVDYADTQRQAALSLEYLVRIFPSVNEAVKHAMGEQLYELFMTNAENMYMSLNAVQADVLVSNKVTSSTAGTS